MIRQIQKRALDTPANTPLFLFHDASGTISSYYALGDLGRDVYAVADARTKDGETETLQAKSRRYYAAIKAIVPEGKILVGGWSLGGMIALQVANIFARDPRVKVDGIIMLDSPFPDYRHVKYTDSESPESDDSDSDSMDDGETTHTISSSTPKKTSIATEKRLEQSIIRSVQMLHSWRVPAWRRERQPYTVMLTASDKVAASGAHPALCFIDQFRDDPTLGWKERAKSVVIDKCYPIFGHHFSLFEPKNVDALTETFITIASGLELAAQQEDDE